MLFTYKAIDKDGIEKDGTIEAVDDNVAILSLQRRGLVLLSINSADEKKDFLKMDISIFSRVSNKDIVILSRQMATLFNAQVSALRIFRLISAEAENKILRKVLAQVADDIQGGSSISTSLAKNPKIFSSFYVSMVRAGEESGRLNETFNYMADYLDRNYELTSKARNALIYPSFVVFTFVTVMVLMFTMVIPKISSLLEDAGQEIPIYTKIVLGISNFFVNYGFLLVIGLGIGLYFLIKWIKTPTGKASFDSFKLSVPYLGNLYRKLYLARLSDNMHTMLVSGIPMIKALELTSNVVDNVIYKDILANAVEMVKSGKPVSEALSYNNEIPGILIQMTRVGEESGELGNILKTLADFYSREVKNAVDTLVDMIEPAMIVMLGLGVGVLLASVLIPIYNISSAGF